jgi:hypothetical protein
MPVAFVISEEWMLRAGVRAELRERGIEALGMETAADIGEAIARRELPAIVVIDSNAKAASDPAVQQLAGRVPSMVIASRASQIAFGSAAKVLSRPVQISEIVSAVMELLKGRSA